MKIADVIFILFAMFLVIGIVSANQEQNQEQTGLDNGDELDIEDLDDNDTENDSDTDDIMKVQEKLQKCLDEGEDCDTEQIKEQVRNRIQNMDSAEVLEQVRSRAAEKGLKIMPTMASDKAIEVLSANFESVEIIEPTEVGETHRYRVLAKKSVKFLGIFDTEIDVEAEVDAETGEVINAKKPWWAFLASETDEEPEEVPLE